MRSIRAWTRARFWGRLGLQPHAEVISTVPRHVLDNPYHGSIVTNWLQHGQSRYCGSGSSHRFRMAWTTLAVNAPERAIPCRRRRNGHIIRRTPTRRSTPHDGTQEDRRDRHDLLPRLACRPADIPVRQRVPHTVGRHRVEGGYRLDVHGPTPPTGCWRRACPRARDRAVPQHPVRADPAAAHARPLADRAGMGDWRACRRRRHHHSRARRLLPQRARTPDVPAPPLLRAGPAG